MDIVYEVLTISPNMKNDTNATYKTLAFAKGEEEDIKQFFDEYKNYQIIVRPIQVFNISPTVVIEKSRCLSRIKEVENQLEQLKKDLKKYKI